MTVTRRLTGLQVGDDPAAWRAAGFTVVDDAVTVGGVRLRLAGDDGPRGILGWQLDPRVTGPVDGLAPAAVSPAADADAATSHAAAADAATADAATAHANGVTALDHLVVASPDPDRTTAALATIGLEPRRSVVGARGDDDVVYRFFLLGTSVLELVGPVSPAGDDPARFVGLAFATERIDALGDLAGTPRDAVQPGRRIATVRTRELGISVPVAMLTPRVREVVAGDGPPAAVPSPSRTDRRRR